MINTTRTTVCPDEVCIQCHVEQFGVVELNWIDLDGATFGPYCCSCLMSGITIVTNTP